MVYDEHELLILARAYRAATGDSFLKISKKALGKKGSNSVERLGCGAGCTLRIARQLSDFFVLRWPPGAAWPPALPRLLSANPQPDSPTEEAA
jgi:hypothetical protein